MGARVAAVAILALLVASSGPRAGPGAGQTGRPAPEITFTMFDGSSQALADYRGTPLVVNYWASWCPPCAAEMPYFEKVHQKLGGEVAFLGVNLQDEPVAAMSLAERTGVTYPLARDPSGDTYALLGGIGGMPTTVFISAQGEIVEVFTGTLTEDLLEERIRRLLLSS